MLCTSDLCTGCSACESICPKGSINMVQNDEGFLEPSINEKICIKCGLCTAVCPILHPPKSNHNPRVYAAIHKNECIVEKSSSGGVFYSLAKKVIDDNGVVFGVKYDETFKVVHDFTQNLEGIKEFQKSKYVQSDTNKSFYAAKRFLLQGKKVLFTGTPCQIAGLSNYLKNCNQDNLICVDLICHGVGSPKVFKDHIRYLERKNKSQIASFCFRNKTNKKDLKLSGKKKSTIACSFKNGKEKIIPFSLDRYSNAFNRCIILRKSCTQCQFANNARVSDITIGDFWGIGKDVPYNRPVENGVSLVLTNSSKGQALFDKCKSDFFIDERSLEEAKKGNHTLYKPSNENKRRSKFFNCHKKYGYFISTSIYTSSLPYRIKYYLKNR